MLKEENYFLQWGEEALIRVVEEEEEAGGVIAVAFRVIITSLEAILDFNSIIIIIIKINNKISSNIITNHRIQSSFMAKKDIFSKRSSSFEIILD